jgi:hypothetical protein
VGTKKHIGVLDFFLIEGGGHGQPPPPPHPIFVTRVDSVGVHLRRPKDRTPYV